MDSIYKVLNVGQGDSIVITPPTGCAYEKEAIVVDTGSGYKHGDITKVLKNYDRYTVFLTHAHSDHVNGFKYLLDDIDKIECIYLPLYQNQIITIANMIMNLKGMERVEDDNEIKTYFREIISNHLYIKHLNEKWNNEKVRFAYQDISFYNTTNMKYSACKHIQCLNPPKYIYNNFSLDEGNLEEIRDMMEEICNRDFTDSFISYLKYTITRVNRREEPYPGIVGRCWIEEGEIEGQIERSGAGVVLGFLLNNYDLLSRISSGSKKKDLKKIRQAFNDECHDTCIVLRTEFKDYSMLLTGDASIGVFKRLIDEEIDIHSYILKLPHHGSCHNIDKQIMDSVDPYICVISHGNRKYKTKENDCKEYHSHPDKETMNLIGWRRILMTNDIERTYKNGKRIRRGGKKHAFLSRILSLK